MTEDKLPPADEPQPSAQPLDDTGPPPFPIPEGVVDLSPEELSPALAAVCFALNRPVTLAEAAAVLGRSHGDVAAAADHLATSLRGSALMLQRHQDEVQLVTRPEVAWAVQRALNPEKPGRLSRPALETLAIVAYRQPLTRAGVEAIRGVNCEAVLDSLERRGLIAEVGRQDTPGHPRLFGTTLRFLQVVGLERIEDLPPLPEGLTVPELPAADWEGETAEAPETAAASTAPAPAPPSDALTDATLDTLTDATADALTDATVDTHSDATGDTLTDATVEVRGEAVLGTALPADADAGHSANGDSLDLLGVAPDLDPDEGYDAGPGLFDDPDVEDATPEDATPEDAAPGHDAPHEHPDHEDGGSDPAGRPPWYP